MSVLDELYNGNINPAEKYIKSGSEYQKLNLKLIEQIDEFTKLLTKDEKQKYEKIEEEIYNINYIVEKERFTEGFCLGVKMILEILNYKGENFI